MNEKRRRSIRLAIDLIERAIAIIGAAGDEESDAYSNLPEQLKDAERGSRMAETAEELLDISSELEDIVSKIDDLI